MPHLHVFRLPILMLAAMLNAQTVTCQSLNEYIKVIPIDGEAGEVFGNSVDLDGEILAIGCRRDKDNGTNSGSVYLFDKTSGMQILKLLPDDGSAQDEFGTSVAIQNGIVVVGAPYDDDNGSGSGSAYIFDASTGLQLLKLLPSDGAPNTNFGDSVAIDDGIVVVGSPSSSHGGAIGTGAVYVFDASTGVELFKCVADDAPAFGYLGRDKIAIHNGVIVAGARFTDDNGTDSGSAYLFDAQTGLQLHKLLPNDGVGGNRFGYSVDIENHTVAIGAIGAYTPPGYLDAGAVYLFDASTGMQLHKLLAGDPVRGSWLGFSVSVSNGFIVAGAPGFFNSAYDAGAAYVFDTSSGIQVAKLLPSDRNVDDQFGRKIVLVNNVVACGVELDDDNGNASGSSYLFDLNCLVDCSTVNQNCHIECTADTNRDGFLSPGDFSSWINAFNRNGPECDQNNDCECNPADFTAWIANYNAGC